jgi:hypothetical protein
MTEAGNPRARVVLSPDEGEKVMMGGLGVRLMVEGAQSGGTFALVEHPIGPRVLAAPLHTRTRGPTTLTCSKARSASRSGTKST